MAYQAYKGKKSPSVVEDYRYRKGLGKGGQRGATLIDVLVAMGIVVLLFSGIYLVYFSILGTVGSVTARSAAAAVLAEQVETVRDLPYANVGVVGGIPAGIIPPKQTVVYGSYTFSVATTIRNIDDPFDGTLGGSPNDTTPADYKLVSFDITCATCARSFDMEMTTTVAPNVLENATPGGALLLLVNDASGLGVPGATVQVVNASVTPTVNLTDITNSSGTLLLVGVPTSTLSYQIFVSRPGYSSEQTYPPGSPGNPNPVLPNATVSNQQTTQMSFAIDRMSQLTVFTSNDVCVARASQPFTLQGSKLIGTSPTVYKFSTSSATDATGVHTFSSLEWDSYTATSTSSSYDTAGTIPLFPLVVNPATSSTVRFVLTPAVDPSLLVVVRDAGTGVPLTGATVRLSAAGYGSTQIAGHHYLTQADWSSGQYASASSVNTSQPGAVILALTPSSTYVTAGWLASQTFDTGSTTSAYYSLSWDPTGQPAGTALQFQLAANNDNATWNFVGPNGTGGSYFSATSSIVGLVNGNRYLRYKAYLSTTDNTQTPRLNDVNVEFTGACVPPGQALFQNLAAGTTYTVDVTAPGYAEATTTVTASPGRQQITVSL